MLRHQAATHTAIVQRGSSILACAIAFAFTLITPAAHAQERDAAPAPAAAPATSTATGPKLALSLADALSTAEARAPDVVMARHASREARARRVGAGVIMPTNPRISADARPPITGGTIGDLGYSAIFEAPFEVGGAPGARVREAERHYDVSRAELALEQLRARSAAWTAYVRAQIAEQRIAATRTAAANTQRIVDASKQRADLGASGDIEQSLASSDAAQIEAQLTDAIRERDLHLMELREVLDVAPNQDIELTTQLSDPDPPPPVDALVARALAQRPEIAVVEKRIQLLDATKERLEKETFPRIGFYTGVDAAPVSPIFGVVGVSVELPFAQRNAGPRAQVAAARDGATSQLDLVRRHIGREVAVARAAFDARRAELETLTTKALPMAQRTLDLVEMGWRSGRFDIFRVASAARDVAHVRSLRLEALEAAWMERISLERAAGTLLASSAGGAPATTGAAGR